MKAQIVDTNVLIYFLQDEPRLPSRAAAMIEDPDRRSLVSMASLWEISIKIGIGKLEFKDAETPQFPNILAQNGFELLPIDWGLMRHASQLPWLHRDPFDRLIVSEALIREIPLLSTDSKLDGYGIKRIGA